MSNELMRLVEDYASLGVHRTGGPADAATVDWMHDQLRARSLDVERIPAPWPGWSGDSSVDVGGSPIEHLVVPHAWTGSVDTSDVQVGSFSPRSGGVSAVLDDAVADCGDDPRPLLLATEHPNGELVGVNRNDLALRWHRPVVLCAGRDLERLRQGPMRVRVSGRHENAVATNLIARNRTAGQASAPLVLTTPLNGWFTCAGERGTGIAVLLDLVERLVDLPLLVLATTGHEVGYFGVRQLLPQLTEPLAAIVHVGASVAVLEEPTDTGDRADASEQPAFASTRVALTSLDDAAAAPIGAALAAVGLHTTANAPGWLGEGTVLCDLDAPLLSITGAGVDFHTPADTPDRATSAAALTAVADAFEEAARLLHAHSQTLGNSNAQPVPS